MTTPGGRKWTKWTPSQALSSPLIIFSPGGKKCLNHLIDLTSPALVQERIKNFPGLTPGKEGFFFSEEAGDPAYGRIPLC